MARYRNKPFVVEAVQWFPGLDVPGVFAVSKAEHLASMIAARTRAEQEPPSVQHYVITIHNQRAYLDPGDWIITEPNSEQHYPCKPDIFAAKYEPAD